MSVLWSLENASLVTQGTQRLADLSLDVQPGITAVLGFSGAGKTSLLNLLVEFEKPTTGSISVTPSAGPVPMFWVPQNGGLWNHVTAADHIRMVQQERTEEVDWLEQFDLQSRANAKPAALSQGERARLAVARALATDASVLVMDEPLAHVDVGRVPGYFDIIARQTRSESRSLVFATHQPELVLRYAKHVICLDAAKCVFNGTVDDLYEKPADSKLATLLGHGNWLSSDEFRLWLDQDQREGVVRPERLCLEAVTASETAVVSSNQMGLVTETFVRNEASGIERSFVHRTERRLEPKQTVRLVVSSEDCDRASE
ncbi:MAG: ATP-binding cassette domain-containing protein [Planctomycetaceae bacterium]